MQETPFDVTKSLYLMFPNMGIAPIPKHITWKLSANRQALTLPPETIFGCFAASAVVQVGIDSGIGNTPSNSMIVAPGISYTDLVYLRTLNSIDVVGNVGDYVTMMYFTKRGYTRL